MQNINWAAVVPWVVVAVVLALRFRRMSRQRRLQPAHLWIIPAFYAVIVVAMVIARPPSLSGWLALLVALGLGSALGWWRGRFTHLEVDAASGTLLMRQSPAGMVLLLVVIFARSGLRYALGGNSANIDTVMDLTDGLLGFALGFLGAYRLELGLRARRLLAAGPATVFE